MKSSSSLFELPIQEEVISPTLSMCNIYTTYYSVVDVFMTAKAFQNIRGVLASLKGLGRGFCSIPSLVPTLPHAKENDTKNIFRFISVYIKSTNSNVFSYFKHVVYENLYSTPSSLLHPHITRIS